MAIETTGDRAAEGFSDSCRISRSVATGSGMS
jgi:hypothetical protein